MPILHITMHSIEFTANVDFRTKKTKWMRSTHTKAEDPEQGP